MILGPDAARYIVAARGERVVKPFHLRWLLPKVCGDNVRRWWAVWALSWPVLAAGTAWLAWGLGWQRAAFAAVVVVALPGVWGPSAVRPIGVDLPAMALSSVAAAAAVHGVWWLAVPFAILAATIKEQAPVWVAVWAWSPVPLVALAAPLVRHLLHRPGMDSVTSANPVLADVHDHPIATAIEAHRGRWRNAWVMVAPWGVGLAGLLHLSPSLVVALVLAYAQLIVATDTVRLYQSAAGVPVALAAAQVIPTPWLALAAVLHAFWWRTPETI